MHILKRENFTEEHIRNLQQSSHRDPVLLESAVYEFGLLEALVRVEMPYIFKGGTCLMLLMDSPRRLSTDIDIIVHPEADLDEYLKNVSEIFPFRDMEEQKQVGKIISYTISIKKERFISPLMLCIEVGVFSLVQDKNQLTFI